MADEEEQEQGKTTRRPKKTAPGATKHQPKKPPAVPANQVMQDEGPDVPATAPSDEPSLGQDLVTGSAAPASPAGHLTPEERREVIAALPPETRNKLITGTLSVHYISRDVDFPMDGESALRMLRVLSATSADIDLIRSDSDARRGWMMIDRSQVIAAQWIPDSSTVPLRPTIDPAGILAQPG